MSKNNERQGLAIAGLIINIILMPGLGSLIGGRTQDGIWQLAIFWGSLIVGLIFTITIIGVIIGIPLMILGPLGAWIWGIITGIDMIKKNS